MIVHRSGEKSLALYIDAEEMAACGFEDIGNDTARFLAEDAISGLGITATLSEVETFSGAGGALIFALLRSPQRRAVFKFANIDSLLDAARSASYLRPGRSALYTMEGAYLLVLFDASDALMMHLSEYAENLADAEGYQLFLSEHGTLLEPEDALLRLSGG